MTIGHSIKTNQRNHYQKVLNLMAGSPLVESMADELQDDSYESFYQHPVIRDYTACIMAANPASIPSSVAMYYHIFLMKRNGEKIFFLEPDMALLLAHTDIKGVAGPMLKTPYREQLIIMPPNFDAIQLYDPRTGNHRLDAVYVSYTGTLLRLLAVGHLNENSTNVLDDTLAYFKFNFDNRDLKVQVREQIEKHRQSPELIPLGGHYNLDIAAKLFDFILNILLYITSPEADMYFETWADVDPSIKKFKGTDKKKAIQRLRSRNNFLKIRVGMKTHLNRESRESYATGRKVDKRTLVMGHWQHYWIGVGREENVLKWKQPFWKGTGELSNVPHKL